MIISFRTNLTVWANSADPDQTAPKRTVKTQIRLLPEEQSDQPLGVV